MDSHAKDKRVLRLSNLYDGDPIPGKTVFILRQGPVCGILRELISPLCRIYASVNRVSIGSDNGLSPIRRQAIIYTNAVVLSIGPLGAISSDFLLKIHFSFTKIHVKISFAKWRLSYSG